jgi:hypothetical protein
MGIALSDRQINLSPACQALQWSGGTERDATWHGRMLDAPFNSSMGSRMIAVAMLQCRSECIVRRLAASRALKNANR